MIQPLKILIVMAACLVGMCPATADDRPNLVLIIADDISWNDLGAYGHPTIKTPVLDQMAKDGMLFNHAYLTASSCSPSRSSILTGRYPHNTGAEQLHWALPAEQTTFSEKLMEAGYWTAMAGKWHLGDEVRERFHVVKEKGYEDGTPTGSEDWLSLLEERPKDKPFFLWLAAWDAHRPWFEENHPIRHTVEDVQLPPYYPATDLYLQDFVDYYDEIARFDLAIGEVVEELKAQGVADNTLIVVIADNGRPYARDKTTMYDSGMKTFFIAQWPKTIAPGGVSDSIISAIDIAPTFLDVAGIEVPPTIEGMSIAQLFTEPQTPFRDYAASERHWHDFEDHGRSIRTKQFRYIINNYNDLPATPSGDTVYHKTWWELVRLNDQGALNEQQARPFLFPRPKEELYDMENDPLSLNNLAGNPEYAAVLEDHRQIFSRWQDKSYDYLPSKRTRDDFDRRTGERFPNSLRPRPSKKDMFGSYGEY